MSNRCYALSVLLFGAVITAGGYNVNALKFTSLQFPGARITEAAGINIHGQVVGSWQDSTTGLGHGFVLSDGVYRSFDVPGARGTYPQDINDDGVIVGAYDLPSHDAQVCCETHGFVLTPEGRLSTITFPGVLGLPVTWLAGINNSGQIVGGYSEFDESIADTRGVHGFLFEDGVFTQIDFPEPAFIDLSLSPQTSTMPVISSAAITTTTRSRPDGAIFSEMAPSAGSMLRNRR